MNLYRNKSHSRREWLSLLHRAGWWDCNISPILQPSWMKAEWKQSRRAVAGVAACVVFPYLLPLDACSSWSPDQHIWTVGLWETGQNCKSTLGSFVSSFLTLRINEFLKIHEKLYQIKAVWVEFIINCEITLFWPAVKTVAWQLVHQTCRSCCWSCGDVKSKEQRCRKCAAVMLSSLNSRCPSI